MMDHVLTNSFTHLQYSTNGIETIAAKCSYELYACIFLVNVKCLHADNRIFAEKKIRDEVNVSNQTITFFAVDVHHQNVIIENYIGVFTCGSRYLLLHAQHR